MRVPTIVLAGVLLTSGGALAVANAQSEPDPTPTSPSMSRQEPSRTPGPPPWAGQGRGRPSDTHSDTDSTTGTDSKTDTDTKTGTGRGPGQNRGRGPDATGPAAYGLCRAWAEQEDPAAKATHVPPFRNLAAAAGGVDKVEEYCAALPERTEDDSDDADDE